MYITWRSSPSRGSYKLRLVASWLLVRWPIVHCFTKCKTRIKMTVKRRLILEWIHYEFELCHYAVVATENICHRWWSNGNFIVQDVSLRLTIRQRKVGLNPEIPSPCSEIRLRSTRSVWGEPTFWKFGGFHHLVPHIIKILQGFSFTLVYK